MVSCILSIVGLDPVSTRVKMHDTPACDSKLLDDDLDGLPRLRNWNYLSVVSALSYLRAMVRPDITIPVQQCARFCDNPHESLIDFEINYLRKYFDLTNEGKLKDYLGTRFTKRKDGSIELSQPHMVSRIISMVGL